MLFPAHLHGLQYGELGETFLEKIIINYSNHIKFTTE